MAARISVKTVRVMAPDLNTVESPGTFDKQNQEALDLIDWDAVETLVNDFLPEGFYCKVED